MKIIIQTNRIRCDVGNCRNIADYSLTPEGVPTWRYINICKDCMQQLYGAMGPIVASQKRKAKSQNKGVGGQNGKDEQRKI